ncbi:MAG: type II toxin-antitoxin system RelE/ParE family toxin [Opitutales bacterium]
MKSQPVEFLEAVEHDLNYALDFYDSWKTGGAQQFLTLFHEAVTWIEWNPEQFPKKHRHFRRVIIRRTYFGIYFAIEPGVTTVVAVLDMRQDPRIIRSMLKLRFA